MSFALGLPWGLPFANSRGGTGVFQPTSIANCQLWLDFSDESSMTLSGSEITAITNKVFGGNASGATPVGTGPDLSTATRNGNKYAEFSAEPLEGTLADMTATTEYTVFLVGSCSNNNQAFLELHTGFVNTGISLFQNPSNSDLFRVRTTSDGLLHDVLVPKSHTDFRLYSGRVSLGGVTKIRKDGVDGESEAIGTTVNVLTEYTIGGLLGTLNLTGNIAEVIVFDRELTDAEVLDVEAYLALKWAIDWKAFDWSVFGSVVAAYNAIYPENTGAAAGAEVASLVDSVGTNDLTPSAANADAGYDWTDDKPTADLPVATYFNGSGLPNIAGGNTPFCVSFAGHSTRGTDTFLFSISDAGTEFNYISLVYSFATGELSVTRRGTGGNSTLNPGAQPIKEGVPSVVTLAYDGANTLLRVDDGNEVSVSQPQSIDEAVDSFAIQGLLRPSPISYGDSSFRECVIFDECPDTATRLAIHQRMLLRNPVDSRLLHEYSAASEENTTTDLGFGDVGLVTLKDLIGPADGSVSGTGNILVLPDGYDIGLPGLDTLTTSLVAADIDSGIASGLGRFTVVVVFSNLGGVGAIPIALSDPAVNFSYIYLEWNSNGNLLLGRREDAVIPDAVSLGAASSGRQIVAFGYDGVVQWGHRLGNSLVTNTTSKAPANVTRLALGGLSRPGPIYSNCVVSAVKVYNVSLHNVSQDLLDAMAVDWPL